MFESISSWIRIRKKEELELAQEQLIKYSLPFFNADDGSGRTARISKAMLDGDGNYLNELSISNLNGEDDKVADNLLMIHGYGAGLGVFCRNYDSMTRLEDKSRKFQLFSIDMLGHSLSSSTPFNFKEEGFRSPKVSFYYKKEPNQLQEAQSSVASLGKLPSSQIKAEVKIPSLDFLDDQGTLRKLAETTKKTTELYENYYVESIEKWRQSKNLSKINLLGHSFGGYLSLCYALKYPDNVEKLILVSPVGIERSVYSINSMKQLSDKKALTGIEASADSLSYSNFGMLTRLPSVFIKLWDTSSLPFGILRNMGPVGVWMASGYASRRYQQSATDEKELDLLSKYVLATFWKKSSTEKAITRLLAPIGAARDPGFDKLVAFKEAQADGRIAAKFPETLWIYGDKDWMDVKAGRAASNYINRSDLGAKSSFKIIPDSGHNIFLDNPQGFTSVIKKFLNWE
ncbi:lysophosphatidic acid acyltransferase [Saccharomycopsis crataegensis]|uniref:Lysophosphatidic acid acyltransferase n=1 Tax=Saccharomycopsis crataegensis TaxID=43959 RepID=A0AAV5QRS2_9ASCO|nr:lysophosphatidic acid acyltransferase [Saccharomycopsis crataegensis]